MSRQNRIIMTDSCYDLLIIWNTEVPGLDFRSGLIGILKHEFKRVAGAF